ncbi:hypothetical protein P0W64_16590 [Tsukamurella sp. 8F]|uniref:hypothetical protein n=1 Tax=unclassified Tsukamurella TaxID=2633480 RepID=UPI0023B9A907|nr:MULTISPECIES: hypothetical protein [unclassified Tsukamurella]MDF0531154.1 hypothetical protein [Tsukamurella sp. 8J]MDF0588400.1 hypothetical protein [Tsukamurella sp. 8F]
MTNPDEATPVAVGGGVGEAISRDGSVHVSVSTAGAMPDYIVTLGPAVRFRSSDELAEQIRVVADIAFERALAEMRADIEARGGKSTAIGTGWRTHAEVDTYEKERLFF